MHAQRPIFHHWWHSLELLNKLTCTVLVIGCLCWSGELGPLYATTRSGKGGLMWQVACTGHSWSGNSRGLEDDGERLGRLSGGIVGGNKGTDDRT